MTRFFPRMLFSILMDGQLAPLLESFRPWVRITINEDHLTVQHVKMFKFKYFCTFYSLTDGPNSYNHHL